VVGLEVAAIPEGLPAVVTIVLAIGTRVMALHHAIVRRLPAVETLGSVTVICSDKTGTLTRNEMTAVRVMLPTHTLEVSGAGYAPEGGFHRDGVALDPAQDEALQGLAHCALLCNDAQLKHDAAVGWQLVGDPTEGALLTLACKAGLGTLEAAAAAPRVDEIPFESEHRFMATLHHDHAGHAFVLLKGAPERGSTCACRMLAASRSIAPPGKRAWKTRPAPDSACWRWRPATCRPARRRLPWLTSAAASPCWGWLV
jgi:magnesium-transporting ATPase (P-type)